MRRLKNDLLKNDNHYNEFKNECEFNRPTCRFNIHILLQMLRMTANGIIPAAQTTKTKKYVPNRTKTNFQLPFDASHRRFRKNSRDHF